MIRALQGIHLGLILTAVMPLHGGKVIVFGDSLSVESALFVRFIEPNSELWHERIADALGLDRAFQSTGFFNQTGTNQAVAGSLISGLSAQVDRFQANHSWVSGDLCLLWIGGNDVRGYAGGGSLQAEMQVRAQSIGNAIRDLYQTNGADRFLVPNLPDIGAIPESLDNPSAAAFRTTVTLAFNAALENELHMLETELPVTIERLDIFKLFNEMLTHSADYGFVNVTEGLSTASGSPDPASYAFYDDIHPTARSHQLIATTARTVLDPDFYFEIISQRIEPDLSLRQTWLANPEITYQILSGSDLNNLAEAASYTNSPAHTVVVPAPGPEQGFYQTRTAPE